MRKVDLKQAIDERLGAAHKTVTKKELRNIGPSIRYKLRDAAGQAREFQNYMLPVDTGDGQRVFLLGVRDNQADAMRYLRIPADPESEMDTFLRLRSALQDPKLREQAARAYVAKAIDSSRAELSGALAQSATKALELFAGQTDKKGPDGKPLGGLQAISDFMESNVPAAERERAGEVLVRILNGVLFEMAQIVRAQAGQAPLEPSEQTQSFMTQAVFSLSDAQFYPVPMVFMLQAGAGQRVPGGACAGQERGVSGLPVSHHRRVLHAVRARPPHLDLAHAPRWPKPCRNGLVHQSQNARW